MWYEVRQQKKIEQKAAETKICVPAGSKWFEGHFPNYPLLPGIAQLGIVFDVISKFYDGPIRIADLSRVRFKQMVFPDDAIDVSVVPSTKRENSFSFRITKENDLVCSGMIAVNTM